MREQLELRLRQLRGEYENGTRILAELESKQASTKETLLRIAGAIQVIEEELAKASAAPHEREALA